jgi:hypothetical protein
MSEVAPPGNMASKWVEPGKSMGNLYSSTRDFDWGFLLAIYLGMLNDFDQLVPQFGKALVNITAKTLESMVDLSNWLVGVTKQLRTRD